MKKALVGVLFAVLTVGVSALCFAAWRPVSPAPVRPDPAPVAHESPSEVLTVSTVLISAPWPKEAPKALRVAARAKTKYECGGWEPSQVGGAYKRCDWR